jgi:hypothetical protein
MACALAGRWRRPVMPVAILLAGLAFWQWSPAVRDIYKALDDPVAKASYFDPVREYFRLLPDQRRVEIPFTFGHWEGAEVASEVPLARGWLRQTDVSRNRLFYDGVLTHAEYQRWLHENGVSWVALPDARLDYSAQQEAAIVRSEPPYLKLRAVTGHWRIYAVRDAGPMLQAGAGARGRLASLGPESFSLKVSSPGDFVVRIRATPYWRLADSGGGCLGRAGDWTLVRAAQPGLYRVTTHFSPARAWSAATGGSGKCSVSPVTVR